MSRKLDEGRARLAAIEAWERTIEDSTLLAAQAEEWRKHLARCQRNAQRRKAKAAKRTT